LSVKTISVKLKTISVKLFYRTLAAEPADNFGERYMTTITYETEHRLKQEIFKQATAIASKYGYHLTGSATNSTGQGFRMNMHVLPKHPRNDEKASSLVISAPTSA
jgi:hypothetical protein